MNQLDESQKTTVKKWIDEGMRLSEIQSRLESEFGLKLTYMETRFLLDDLKMAPQDVEPPADLPQQPEAAPAGQEEPPSSLSPEEPTPAGGASKVNVSVDQLARPGAMISGKVTFSDGKQAEWYLHQMGRLGVAPQEEGYKPSQTDLMDFQTELQSTLAKMGYG